MSAESHILDTPLQQARGVIGRYPDVDEEYVFEFGDVAYRVFHMVGVRKPLQVEFYVDGKLKKMEILSPWIGLAIARADRVIERRPTRWGNSGKRVYRAESGTDQESVAKLVEEVRSTISHANDQGTDSVEVIIRE